MKKRFWKWLSITCALVLVVGIVVGVVVVASWKNSDEYIDFDKSRLNEVYTTLTVLDDNGSKLNEPLYIYNYKQIPLEALHDYTYMSFVAVEDKRFFDHNGIDYKRIFGAMAHNLKSGNYKEGASTISQQLIKNTHLNNNKTLQRKVNELFLARELERNYSKTEILEMYLNTIYFGRSAYGIETAANVYFNKSASELTVSESAVLAGMIKAPNNYAPDKNPEKCVTRRNNVLKLMLQQNVINQEQYDEAIESEIIYAPQTAQAEKTYTYHVMKEACALLNMTPMQLAQSNFIIETYCNQQTQSELTKLVNDDATLTKDGNLADLSCVVTNTKGGVEACYFRGESAGTKRQVGSALKPIAVYAPALNERIITEASPVLDEETDFNGYKPSNAGGYNGWTTIKYSVAKSLNIPAVKTLNALGLDKAEAYLRKLGINGEQNLSLALGNAAGGIDTLTLAKCYCTLANDGVSNDVGFIKNIYGEHGLVFSREHKETRVYNVGANYLMTDMLVNTVKNGTAKKLNSGNYQVAAKTGTVGNADGNSDGIIAGYTTENAFVVWYSGNLPNDVNGSTAPATFANNLLNKMYKNKRPKAFSVPDNIVDVKLDKNSLYNDQKMLIATDGENFRFENVNKPKEHLVQTVYDYTIKTTSKNNDVKLELPYVENGKWELYKYNATDSEKLDLNGNIYTSTIDCDTEYYAELIVDNKLVYTTPKTKVFYINSEKEDKQPAPSIKDFWYWR